MVNISNLFIRIKEKGLTAKKVSDATGISTGNLSDWKSGRCFPSAEKLDTLADYLDCSVDYLLGREKERTANAVPDMEEKFSTIRITGKDGKIIEKHLTDEQLDAWMKIIESLPDTDFQNK